MSPDALLISTKDTQREADVPITISLSWRVFHASSYSSKMIVLRRWRNAKKGACMKRPTEVRSVELQLDIVKIQYEIQLSIASTFALLLARVRDG